MHNLKQSITEWRTSMKSAPNLGPDALDELESHLREIVEQQVRSGVAEPEAFQRAVAQLGSASTVATEFQKLKSPVWLPMKVAGVVMGLAAMMAIYGVLSSRPRAGHDLLLAVHVIVLSLGHVAALLLGTLGICFVCQRSWSKFSNRRLESVCRSVRAFARVAAGLVAIGIILGMVWAKMNWGAFWNWDPKEMGSLCTLLWLVGFLAAHSSRRFTPRGLLTASVLNLNAEVLGWFVVSMHHTDLHSYGMPSFGPFVISEAVGLPFFFLGFAPAGWMRLRRKEA